MNRSSLRPILVGFGLLVLVMAANLWITYWNTHRLYRNAQLVARANDVLLQIEKVMSDAKDAETGQRGFLLTGDESYLGPYAEREQSTRDGLTRLAALTPDDPRQSAQIERLQQLVSTKFAELYETVALRRKVGFDAAAAIVRTNLGKHTMDQIRTVAQRMEAEENRVRQQRERESKVSYETAVAAYSFMALLDLGSIGVAVWLIRRELLARHAAENVVVAEKARLHTTLTSIGDAVIVTDSSGHVVLMNSVAEHLTGWGTDATGVELERVFRIVNSQTRQTVESPVVKVLREGVVVGLANHTILLARDGRETPIDDSGAPIRDEDGAIAGVVLVFRDITGRQQAERELQEADRRKDEFLALLAHELRNPLAPISSSLELLRLRGTEAPELRKPLEVIERQVRNMTRLIDDLLDVARITQGKIELRKSRVDLRQVMTEGADISRPLIEQRRHELTIDLPKEPVWLDADPVRLEQVLSNLLNNAAKYSEPGSPISMKVEVEPNEVVIRVRDSGIGIAPDMIERIFEIFAQAERTLDRSQGGLGIGLTLARSLVEMHGGTIDAHSDGPGRGSELVVRLPLASNESVRETVGTSIPIESPAAGLRVLVVDDNVDSASGMAEVLRLWGHHPAVAYDGQGALDTVERFGPSVVLLDIGLPKMDGYEVARRLRQRSSDGLVLIALTGYGQDEDKEKSREAGFDLHLTKPINHEALRDFLATRNWAR